MRLGIKTAIRNMQRYVFVERFPDKRLKHGDTTQYGELSFLLDQVGTKNNGFIVDVGANDGYTHSNSYPFIRMGWGGLLLEPDPNTFLKLQGLHANNSKVRCINCAAGEKQSSLPLYLGSEGQSGYSTLCTEQSDWYEKNRSSDFIEVDVEPITNILNAAHSNVSIDIMSIDTEGYDYFVLKGLDFSLYRPTIIVTEDEKPPYKNTNKKEELLRTQGYRLLRRFHNNAIYRHE
jgi:FkbM family methyltransferase